MNKNLINNIKPFIYKTGIVGRDRYNTWLNPETPHNYKGSLLRHITIEKILYFIIDNIIRHRITHADNSLLERFLEFPFRFLCGINCNFPIHDVILCSVHELKGTKIRFLDSPYLIKEESKNE